GKTNAHAPTTSAVVAVLLGGIFRRPQADIAFGIKAGITTGLELAADDIDVAGLPRPRGADRKIAAGIDRAVHSVLRTLRSGAAAAAVAQADADLGPWHVAFRQGRRIACRRRNLHGRRGGGQSLQASVVGLLGGVVQLVEA